VAGRWLSPTVEARDAAFLISVVAGSSRRKSPFVKIFGSFRARADFSLSFLLVCFTPTTTQFCVSLYWELSKWAWWSLLQCSEIKNVNKKYNVVCGVKQTFVGYWLNDQCWQQTNTEIWQEKRCLFCVWCLVWPLLWPKLRRTVGHGTIISKVSKWEDWSPKFGLGLGLGLRNRDFPTPWPKIISQWNTYDVLTIVDICACGL
jgi:hypothetical protein